MDIRPVINTLTSSLCALLLASPAVVLAQDDAVASATDMRLTYQSMLEEAERARMQAEQARLEASKAAERARAMAHQEAQEAREEAGQQREQASRVQKEEMQMRAAEREQQREEMERVRDELSRAHRELREASREVAEAHRALARDAHKHAMIRQMNLGERAVLGVVLGRETNQGVEIIGVSPGGPSEQAGLQAGDLLLTINGQSLAREGGDPEGNGRETLFRVMDGAEAGATLVVQVLRDGQTLDFDVTAERREPSSWQTMIRIPEAPTPPSAPHAPSVVIEHLEVPQIDEEAINARIHALEHELQGKRFIFVAPDGGQLELTDELELPDGFDFDVEAGELSELAGHALQEANIWFGLPQAQGLELAAINEGLGAYFKTDRGVLVIRAREDNAYRLESGDVVLAINSRPVNSPTDLMRVLREIEPGSEMEIAIKRARKNKTLSVVMPENRLGYAFPLHGEPAVDR